jgi:SAM-dependent methyltransferase
MVLDAEVSAPMVDQALAWLAGRVPGARQVIDVGSGPGVAACTLARLLPDAQVLAVDGAEPLLTLARERADRSGAGARFSTRQATLPDDLAHLPQADLIWVSGVAHHLPDPQAALRSLGALLKPGGVLAVREGGLPTRFVPAGADAGLCARLDAIGEAMVAGHDHPAKITLSSTSWPEQLRGAGLTAVQSRTFLLDLPAPLPQAARRLVHTHLRMQRDMLGDHIAADDRKALEVLLDEDSADGVLHRGDVFLLSASTVHTGER